MTDRVVVLVDMDCFYCQVEARLDPSLNGKPMAVVQYNQWKGGGIIAVNYEARDRGVTRHMRGAEAKEQCPEIILVTVPTVRDKADLTRYRDAGREVLSVFCRFSDCVQRASIDEAYIDLTSLVNERMANFNEFDACNWKSTFVVGYTTDGSNEENERQNGMKTWLEDCESIYNTPSLKLAIGAMIVEEMRDAVLAETGFKCSAGIAHNKILAKLACGLHKPNRQTVLPQESVEILYRTLPVKKIRNLGGKFGDEVVEKLGCKTMSDLAKYTERELQSRYDEKNGTWLYNIARGYDFEAVTPRLTAKSIGCCKNFPGKQALIKSEDVYHWLNKLAEELSERLFEDETMHKRKAHLLTVSTNLEINKNDSACSKSIALVSYSSGKIASQAEFLLKKICKFDAVAGTWNPPIKLMGLSAGKFSETTKNKIDKFFKVLDNPEKLSVSTNNINVNKTIASIDSLENNSTKFSFFEKLLNKDGNSSSKKLHLVPDLTRNDLFVDSDNSQSSLTKLKQCSESTDTLSKESVKKNLFRSSETETTPSIISGNNNTTHKIVTKKVEQSTSEVSKNSKSKDNEVAGSSSILSFLGKAPKRDCWIKPEELFPDPSQVDEELLALLPESYRTKILKMKEKALKRSVTKEIENRSPVNDCGDNEKRNCNILDNTTANNSRNVNEVIFHSASTHSSPSSKNIENSTGLNKHHSTIDPTHEHLVVCAECGLEVPDYEEHMDMHFAKKLHHELNSFSTVLIKKVVNSNEKGKRKKINSKAPASNVKKLKSIDTFFKR